MPISVTSKTVGKRTVTASLESISDTQTANTERPTGLRERQKVARYERILSSARSLFNTLDFDNTTMAAIAEHAEVSTPTVFNYFNTKDQLLLALVLQVHHETQEWVHGFKAQATDELSLAICDFLSMYTKMSLKSINRQTWRHVLATRIRMPDSDFVAQYDALTREMSNDFYAFLKHTLSDRKQAENGQLKVFAKIIFNHWSLMFVELVRNENLDLDEHADRLRSDMSALFGVTSIN